MKPAQMPVAEEQTASAPYRLGPQDVISVKVVEWRPSIDQIYAWEALNDKYTIGPAGQLALPLVGEIPVLGLTTGDLAQRISEQLKDRMRLAAPPDATVEIVEYRPMYLFGQVEKPGQYPYQPGMTVLRAVSVASGLVRTRDPRLQREAITSRGELDVLLSELDGLIARNARLEAELAGATEITFPPALADQKDQPHVMRLMEQEKLIFEARNFAYATQLSATKQLKVFLEQEVQSLKNQRDVHNTQQRLVTEELEKVRGLASKGLTTGTRQLELERLSAQLEGDGLRLDGSAIKAKQDISRTDIAILELQNKRKSDVTVDLRETKRLLEQVQSKRNTAAKLVYDSEVIAPGLLLDDDTGDAAQMVYKIVRNTGGKTVEFVAGENTPVLPGDTIKVEAPKGKRRGSELSAAPEGRPRTGGLASAGTPEGDVGKSR
ncbi:MULTISPECIES: polysaccharide biosynthesis/export family protein [Rhodomicrobium]|uniref:polysaccharide biosynthesis/export family protein n=1 Tax=Rhodomicrobium TaxID=1068 RepID=UPI0014821C45|nr:MULTISPECIES: polysaccharide biosynthesis/export family protein [Rhodomicrobium]